MAELGKFWLVNSLGSAFSREKIISFVLEAFRQSFKSMKACCRVMKSDWRLERASSKEEAQE